MATFDTSRATYGSARTAGRFSHFVSKSLASVIAWNDARVTRNALSALSDRELDDIGLTRGDIDVVVVGNFIR